MTTTINTSEQLLPDGTTMTLHTYAPKGDRPNNGALWVSRGQHPLLGTIYQVGGCGWRKTVPEAIDAFVCFAGDKTKRELLRKRFNKLARAVD